MVGPVPVGSVTADITTAFTGGTYRTDRVHGASDRRDDRARRVHPAVDSSPTRCGTRSPRSLGGAEDRVVNPGRAARPLTAPRTASSRRPRRTGAAVRGRPLDHLAHGGRSSRRCSSGMATYQNSTVPSRPYLPLGLSDNVAYAFDAAGTSGVAHHVHHGGRVRRSTRRRATDRRVLVPDHRRDDSRIFNDSTDARDSGLVDRDSSIAYLQRTRAHPDFARQSVSVPAVPSTVTAGDTLAFPVTSSDLTSLGSPLNTSLDVPARRGVHRHGAGQRRRRRRLVTIPAATPAPTRSRSWQSQQHHVTLPAHRRGGRPSTTTLAAAPSSRCSARRHGPAHGEVTADVPLTGSWTSSPGHSSRLGGAA